jgi:hypothetical protein
VGGFVATGPSVPGLGEPRQFAIARFIGASTACTSDADCPVCERCGTSNVCENGPRSTCERPAFPGAKLRYTGGPVPPRIVWKWKRTAAGATFDPSTDSVGVCLWWGRYAMYEASVPPGPPWRRVTPSTVVYRAKGTPFGLRLIKVGKSLTVQAKGEAIEANPYGFPDSLLTPGDDTIDLDVQLHASNGSCWGATYPQAGLSAGYPSHLRSGTGM